MQKRISNTLLVELSDFVTTQIGLHFQKGRRLDLLRGIRSASKEFGFDDVEQCINWLLSKPLSKQQIEILASHLTVGETYFLREPKVFDALEKHIFPAIIRQRMNKEKRIRIWSAGCCTGEEAYTTAIFLEKLIPDIADWNIKILATDINPVFLNKAVDGQYREWSFRGTPYWLKETYFNISPDGIYEIIPRIKRMVTFQYLNLVEDSYPSVFNETNAMDLIFCRNVLMYFSTEQVRNCIERFHHCLLDDSILIVASSETSPIFSDHFISENYPGAILYRKRDETVHPKVLFPGIFIEENTDSDELLLSLKPVSDPLEQPNKDFIIPEAPTVEASMSETELNQSREALIGKAGGLIVDGHYADAIEILLERVGKNGHDGEIMTMLAKSFANLGDLAQAFDWCEKAIKADKLNVEGYHLQAVILMERGESQQAVGALKRVLYLNPDSIMAHFMLGNVTQQMGRISESDKHFENALKLLEGQDQEAELPSSDGMTVGRLREMIPLMIHREKLS